MATESPVRMVEGRKWSSNKDAASYGSPLKSSIAAEELGLLLKGHRMHADQSESVPNRSGSAPPSMEGSFAAIGNLLAQQNLSMNPNLESLHNAMENCESEEQLRSDPAYLAYYCSNINLNPRLPPPLLSRENRRLVRHIGGLGNNWRSTSVDDSGNVSLHLAGASLSTHKEEPEDERSPKDESENSFDNSNVLVSGHGATFAAGRHKSLVDLIQEDFPRTPSPVYSHSRSSGPAADDAEHDIHAVTSNISSISLSEAPEKSSGSDVDADAYEVEVNALKLSPGNDSQTSSFPRTPPKKRDESGTNEAGQEGDSPIIGSIQSGIVAESRMRNRQEEQQSYSRNAPQQHPSVRQTNPHQAHGVQALMVSQAMNHPHSPVNNISHGHSNFPSIDVQSSLNSSTLNPPLYATAAAYMTAGSPFYPNFQPSGLYSPHFGMGGYAMGSTFLPPFMTGYPSHGPMPMPFGAGSAPGTDGRTAAPLTGENITHIGGSHQPGKFYGPHGLMLQPQSLMDPLHMQYFQHPFGDAYGATVQHDHLASGGTSGAQFEAFAQRRELSTPTFLGDRNLQPPTYGNLSIPSPGKIGVNGNSYYGGPGSMGVMSQFPASPLPSPVLPSSPVGAVNHFSRRSEGRYPQASNRNTGLYSGGQGPRGINSFDDHKRHYFLEELKSSNARKFELSDIVGHIVEFRFHPLSSPPASLLPPNKIDELILCFVCSVDQHGSRFIQQKLEHCSAEEKDSVFKEVLPHASKLMTDVFGNYVIQKFFEHGSSEQRKELADKLAGQVLELSLQMYGCRVIQKALEVIELDQKAQLVQELDGHVMRCVRDQNGNHVIQKCIECLPSENIEFIISAFRGQVATLSTHPYGCRVIQRVLEHCSEGQQSQCIVDEILESSFHLAQDQYGNYVTQHVLERGKSYERSQIISKLNGKVIQMSQHKYASNVVEKCLEYGDVAERDLLIEEIIRRPEDNDGLLTMMKDQFANYVIQKILDIGSDRQKEVLLNHIKVHINALKKYTYGKHIVARYEQLCGEESQAPES
ncbi:Pumilio homolog 5 [Linum perenne]